MPRVLPFDENEWQLMHVGIWFITTGAKGREMSRNRHAMSGTAFSEIGWMTPEVF